MTTKKENILKTALQLFACEGFSNTPTSKIAKLAGVSEALIFRHFGNKKQLLEAILTQGKEKAQIHFNEVINETDPLKIIEKSIELPFTIITNEPNYWQLLFILKWQNNYHQPENMESLRNQLNYAFLQLNYTDPQTESTYLMVYLEALSSALLRNQITNKEKMLHLIKSKYGLLQ
jgi:AcrR family transcriptional regulator